YCAMDLLGSRTHLNGRLVLLFVANSLSFWFASIPYLDHWCSPFMLVVVPRAIHQSDELSLPSPDLSPFAPFQSDGELAEANVQLHASARQAQQGRIEGLPGDAQHVASSPDSPARP